MHYLIEVTCACDKGNMCCVKDVTYALCDRSYLWIVVTYSMGTT